MSSSNLGQNPLQAAQPEETLPVAGPATTPTGAGAPAPASAEAAVSTTSPLLPAENAPAMPPAIQPGALPEDATHAPRQEDAANPLPEATEDSLQVYQEDTAALECRKEEHWGTVFAGGREHALGGIEQSRSVYWTEADEAAYLERVKNKASAMASDLISKAQAEAAGIRDAAHLEGYNTGLAEAKEELETFRASIADNVASVLTAIEGQCTQVFRSWQEDIVSVARLAVEKATAITLNEERAAVLANVIEQAVLSLEEHRVITVRVHPEDEDVVSDIMQSVKEKHAGIHSWKVTADSSLGPGGLQLETGSSLAQSTAESRLAAVDAVLRHLSLPEMP